MLEYLIVNTIITGKNPLSHTKIISYTNNCSQNLEVANYLVAIKLMTQMFKMVYSDCTFDAETKKILSFTLKFKKYHLIFRYVPPDALNLTN
jgi:hypothetical protein